MAEILLLRYSYVNQPFSVAKYLMHKGMSCRTTHYFYSDGTEFGAWCSAVAQSVRVSGSTLSANLRRPLKAKAWFRKGTHETSMSASERHHAPARSGVSAPTCIYARKTLYYQEVPTKILKCLHDSPLFYTNVNKIISS